MILLASPIILDSLKGMEIAILLRSVPLGATMPHLKLAG
jgi:hypothetical protein